MPAGTDIARRNRALIAFTWLTGIRDGALASLKLKHVNVAETRVNQDPREVKTSAHRQAEIIRNLSRPLRAENHLDDLARKVLEIARREARAVE
jgi:integrase